MSRPRRARLPYHALMVPNRFQDLTTQTQMRNEDNYKPYYSWGLPMKSSIGGIGLWPLAHYMRTRVYEFEMRLCTMKCTATTINIIPKCLVPGILHRVHM